MPERTGPGAASRRSTRTTRQDPWTNISTTARVGDTLHSILASEPRHETPAGYGQGSNGQLAVGGEHQVIVAQALTNQALDVEHLEPMLELVEASAGDPPARLTADAG